MKSLQTIIFFVSLSLILVFCKSEQTISHEETIEAPIELTISNPDEQDLETTVKEEMSAKKSTLNDLIGEYKLVSIEGFAGANTMMDYFIQKGKWVASGSSISDGMRESYDIDISKAELVSLQTMKIVVAGDLSVTLFCENKAYFKAAFQEDGMTYLLKNTPKDYINMEESLKKTTVFIDEYLYLYAKDNLIETEISPLDIAGVNADVVVIKYNTKTKQFEMVLFYGDCCDSSSYIFK